MKHLKQCWVPKSKLSKCSPALIIIMVLFIGKIFQIRYVKIEIYVP